MKIKFKQDEFKNVRGSYSRLLKLTCRLCGAHVLDYQKDGPGSLMRCYLDRIFWPDAIVELQDKEIKDIQSFVCTGCGEVLGTPYIYELENRKAIRLYHDAVITKIQRIG